MTAYLKLMSWLRETHYPIQVNEILGPLSSQPNKFHHLYLHWKVGTHRDGYRELHHRTIHHIFHHTLLSIPLEQYSKGSQAWYEAFHLAYTPEMSQSLLLLSQILLPSFCFLQSAGSQVSNLYERCYASDSRQQQIRAISLSPKPYTQ